ncbi:MAG: IMP dehydrogenase [Candidatus Magasanikbacteria bacterium]|jgi:IMP dehydrogenase|nr:IMP dehydrogenase [Candidatus Magasanikbacteria bacterium]MBT4315166.1 IMP dehydrogenase [Candidatus Magasanikbacteria bacterium]MBT4547378.1 IMP dehydrogenase [Candidatus Magasanikbacteria bacterium]MBT6818848.1 IMP dehydrogenase [Candidatus Magasanikbacteria bacterium]
MHIPLALTYDDVLIVPRRSTLSSRSEANTKTRLSRKINLNIPIVTANMDTVTGSDMAIAMARLGGIGILHRFMSIEENAEEVRRVKRAQSMIVQDPYKIAPDKTVDEARDYVASVGITGLLVSNDDNKLQGILSRRDFIFANGEDKIVADIMTPREKLITGNAHTTFDEAKKIFAEHKIEKLPLVDVEDRIIGLITSDDIKNIIEYPLANRDENGQLIVGAAVGVHGDYIERAQELVKAGVDVLVIDIAHGHSDLMFNAVEKLREVVPDVQLIAGNVATATATKELCEAGVDAIKVGVGPGTICITRLVTGCGMPQLTAVMEAAKVAKRYGVPVIADGGIGKSGDIIKAIGAGADCVMMGGMFAGTDESPGIVMTKGDKKFKVCRGSASFTQSHTRKRHGLEKKNLKEVVPEGVESLVPYKGPVEDIIGQMVGGVKSGMSYTNSHTIAELQNNVEFVRMTSSGSRESGSHDVQAIT